MLIERQKTQHKDTDYKGVLTRKKEEHLGRDEDQVRVGVAGELN